MSIISSPFKSKWLRLTVYSYFSGPDILTKLAVLSTRERELICNSKLLVSKNLKLPINIVIGKTHSSCFNPWQSLPDDHFLFNALTSLRYHVCFSKDKRTGQGRETQRLVLKVPQGLNEDCLRLTIENNTSEELNSAIQKYITEADLKRY